MRKIVCFIFIGLCGTVELKAQAKPIYKHSKYPIEQRVNDLISRMTPTEKFWQLFMIPGDLGDNPNQYQHGIFGFQVSAASMSEGAGQQMLQYNTKENALLLAKKINQIQRYFINQTRLGIPFIPFDEALHGLVRNGATAFPQSIALAASFDTLLMQEVASAIATETKARGIRDILSPVLNIASDVRWGRTEETYGEDPLLVTSMAANFIKQFESVGIVTTPKHFIANVGDGGRDSYPIHMSNLLLHELYLPPFKHAVQNARARSIMTAYNSVNGSPSSANDWLLNKTLKKDWGFKGFVISDAGAVGGSTVLHHTTKDYPASGADAMINGLDVIFQTSYSHHQLFIKPFLDGTIPTSRIDDAVKRVLRVKFALGLFDQPYVDESLAANFIQYKQHKSIAKKAALKSVVLLKNEQQILPLNAATKTIALIGEDAVKARLGGYSGPGNGTINILEGIKSQLSADQSILYAEGASLHQPIFSLVSPLNLFTDSSLTTNGLTASFYKDLEPGNQLVKQVKVNQINASYTFMPPDATLPTDHYSIRYEGVITVPNSGYYHLALKGNDGFRLFLNGQLLVNQWDKISYHQKAAKVYLEKGKAYPIKVEFYESKGNGLIKFLWAKDGDDLAAQKIEAACKIAKQSDVAIVVAGIHEGEFQDRASLALPAHQEQLIEAIVATGKPVVVLLIGGSAITMKPWINQVKGIMMVWYPGEEGGNAVADLIFGKANPAGRLPITFPQSEGQLPLVYHHKPTGRGDDYHDLSGEPLFPFGFGLSYTQFTYNRMQLSTDTIKGNQTVTIRVDVSNIGKMAGEEVVQLYIRDELSSVATPVMALKGFQRVSIAAGGTKTLYFNIDAPKLSLINNKGVRITEPGLFRLMVGPNSRYLPLKQNLVYVQ
jgi:beta-glucosidase